MNAPDPVPNPPHDPITAAALHAHRLRRAALGLAPDRRFSKLPAFLARRAGIPGGAEGVLLDYGLEVNRHVLRNFLKVRVARRARGSVDGKRPASKKYVARQVRGLRAYVRKVMMGKKAVFCRSWGFRLTRRMRKNHIAMDELKFVNQMGGEDVTKQTKQRKEWLDGTLCRVERLVSNDCLFPDDQSRQVFLHEVDGLASAAIENQSYVRKHRRALLDNDREIADINQLLARSNLSDGQATMLLLMAEDFYAMGREAYKTLYPSFAVGYSVWEQLLRKDAPGLPKIPDKVFRDSYIQAFCQGAMYLVRIWNKRTQHRFEWIKALSALREHVTKYPKSDTHDLSSGYRLNMNNHFQFRAALSYHQDCWKIAPYAMATEPDRSGKRSCGSLRNEKPIQLYEVNEVAENIDCEESDAWILKYDIFHEPEFEVYYYETEVQDTLLQLLDEGIDDDVRVSDFEDIYALKETL